MARYTEAQAKSAEKYLKNFDSIHIRVPKGKREEYQELAKSSGKSLNQFIIDLVEESKKEAL